MPEKNSLSHDCANLRRRSSFAGHRRSLIFHRFTKYLSHRPPLERYSIITDIIPMIGFTLLTFNSTQCKPTKLYIGKGARSTLSDGGKSLPMSRSKPKHPKASTVFLASKLIEKLLSLPGIWTVVPDSTKFVAQNRFG